MKKKYKCVLIAAMTLMATPRVDAIFSSVDKDHLIYLLLDEKTRQDDLLTFLEEKESDKDLVENFKKVNNRDQLLDLILQAYATDLVNFIRDPDGVKERSKLLLKRDGSPINFFETPVKRQKL